MIKEQREHLRISQEESITVEMLPDGEQEFPLLFECFSRDFSYKGIRLHGRVDFKVDSEVDLVVHMSDENKDYNLHGIVKWVTETTEHEVLAGIELSATAETDLTQWQIKYTP